MVLMESERADRALNQQTCVHASFSKATETVLFSEKQARSKMNHLSPAIFLLKGTRLSTQPSIGETHSAWQEPVRLVGTRGCSTDPCCNIRFQPHTQAHAHTQTHKHGQTHDQSVTSSHVFRPFRKQVKRMRKKENRLWFFVWILTPDCFIYFLLGCSCTFGLPCIGGYFSEYLTKYVS